MNRLDGVQFHIKEYKLLLDHKYMYFLKIVILINLFILLLHKVEKDGLVNILINMYLDQIIFK